MPNPSSRHPEGPRHDPENPERRPEGARRHPEQSARDAGGGPSQTRQPGRFKLGLVQCRRPDDGDVIEAVRRWAGQAREEGVDLLVFPEALMTRFDGSVENFAAAAEPASGTFARAVDGIAAERGLWIAYTINERNDGALPYNTAIITDAQGIQRSRYRKVHLFDAQGYRESMRMSAGDELMAPVEAPFASLGLGICYDLRFPEVARDAALGGAQVMLYPAAWVDGPNKVMQWETLLRARAIENGLFVAGVSSCEDERIGNSRVFGPDGTLICSGGRREELVTCSLDLEDLRRTRAATPSLEHRRPACYRAGV